MPDLKDFALCNIDWNLTPEHAVTMYLEWGNNDWHAEYPPVRSKEDVSHYFVVDSWQDPPVVRLVRRNSERAERAHAADEHAAHKAQTTGGDDQGKGDQQPPVQGGQQLMAEKDRIQHACSRWLVSDLKNQTHKTSRVLRRRSRRESAKNHVFSLTILRKSRAYLCSECLQFANP